MNEFKGTKGPWVLAHSTVFGHGMNSICSMLGRVDMPVPKANAQLIAAAPELLGSVQSLVEELEKYQHTPHPEGCDGARDYLVNLMTAKAALRKALGEKV